MTIITGSTCIIGALAFGINVNAQTDVMATYKELMPKKIFEQVVSNSELYAGYLLGECFEVVRGKPLVEHETSLSNWKKLGDAEIAMGLELFDPKISPDTFTIIDISENRKSCWTQHDTISAPLSAQLVLQALINQPAGHYVMTKKDGGEGWQERTFLFNPKDGHNPAILYLRITFSPKAERIIGIVQETSKTETKKNGR